MEISAELYNWLCSAGVAESGMSPDENSLIKLEEKDAEMLENGLNFTPLIKRLNKVINHLEREQTPMPEINTLKEVKTPASKLYNWKILSTALENFGLVIDSDTRSLIIAGDRDMVVDVLQQIYNAEQAALVKLSEEMEKGSLRSIKASSSIGRSSSKLSLKPITKRQSLVKKKKKPDGALYIEAVDGKKSLEETETCLEFLLVSFCRHFSLRPKQAAGLLTQNGKYLSHVISKGLKGKHDPIINWYQEIYSVQAHLIKLMSQEEASGSIPLMLSSLRSGFLSKNLDTVLWCCRLFSKLGLELLECDMLPPAWDWFVNEGGGIEACLQASNRFTYDVKPQIVSVLIQFGRNTLFELFTIQLRNYIPDTVNYFATINEFLPSLCEMRTSKQELANGGIISFWLEMCIRESDSDKSRPADVRIAGINFLCDLWMLFPNVVENHEEISTELLNTLKRALRDKLDILKFACIAKVFHLLENFANERNSFAPIIYKTLTFYLVENYRDHFIREIILSNFSSVFDSILNIPIAILLEPLVKQLQVANDANYSPIDFDFFIKIAKHPRLALKNAVQTMDVLGKIYMNEELFTKAAAAPFMLIATRFIEGSSVQEYLFRFAKYSLTLSLKFELRKKIKEKDAETLDWELKQKYQRDIMLEMTERIIKIRNETLNERILSEICIIAEKSQSLIRREIKFVLILLKLYGDPKEILALYEKEKPKSEKVGEYQAKADEVDEELQEIEEPKKEIKKKNATVKRIPRPTISKSSSGSLPILNLTKKGRVMFEIEKIRQNMIEKEIERRLKEEKDKLAHEKKKIALRKQLEKRRIELRAGPKGERSSLAEEVKIDGLILFREISQEEREMINHVFKRYLRAIKLLFKKYSSTGYKNTRVGKETFETAAEKNLTLSESEYYKLLKEQGVLQTMITPEESNLLLKTYCHRLKKPQVKITFQEFQDILIQTSIFIYSKPPKDLSHLPPVVSLKALFDHFRSHSSEKGISSRFYNEPDPGMGDREVVKRLNLILEKDSNAVMPEGYRKVTETDIEIVYKVPEVLEFTESNSVAVGALDDILFKCLGVHFLEPIIVVKQVTRARGVLTKPQISSIQTSGTAMSSKFNMSDTSMVQFRASYKPPANFVELLLTPGIKFEIARLTGVFPNETLNECAKVLDDLIHTVDSGSLLLISRNSKTKIVNKAQQGKEVQEQQKKIEAETKEKRRRLRKQLIENRLKKIRENKEKKTEEEKQKKQLEKATAEENKLKRDKLSQIMKEKRMAKIEEWKQKKKIDDEEQKKSEEEKKMKAEEERKKKREKFLQSVKKKIHVESTQKHDEKAEEQKREQENIKKAKEFKVIKRKKIEAKILQSKKYKEAAQKQHEDFERIKNDAKVREIFDSMQKSLEMTFVHYCKVAPAKDGTMQNTLNFVGFNKFCVSFNIIPGLLPNEECVKNFKLIAKGKKQGSSEAMTLNAKEFEEILLRLSLVAKEKLEKNKNVQFGNDEEALKGFFEYLNIKNDTKAMRDMLKSLEVKSRSSHPREKRKLKNQLLSDSYN